MWVCILATLETEPRDYTVLSEEESKRKTTFIIQVTTSILKGQTIRTKFSAVGIQKSVKRDSEKCEFWGCRIFQINPERNLQFTWLIDVNQWALRN
jgi:hypothetical protein